VTARREALLARFRARSLDRTRRLSLALLELEGGRGGPETMKEAARELHTLKGDCTVVGLEVLSRAAHAAEGHLLASRGGEGRPSAQACADVRRCLEPIDRVLREELKGPAADAAVQAVVEELGLAPPPPSAPAPEGPPLPPAPSEPAAPPGGGGGPAQRWMQVQVTRVDELCERVSDFAGEFRGLSRELAAAIPADGRNRNLHEALDRSRGRLDDLIGNAWALRLVPVEPALEELVQHAHALAETQGKRLRVQVDGQGAEVERSVLDQLWEPLLHLVRNAVDHGLEGPAERAGKNPIGSLVLRARPAGPYLSITIADDGRGIDVEAVRAAALAHGVVAPAAARLASRRELLELIFRHGFSTRAEVSGVSGRGVGLDVVRQRAEAMGGTVSVTSEAGSTCFELRVQATITRERAVVLAFGNLLLAVPSSSVVEVVRLDTVRPVAVAGGRALPFRDEIVPLRSLAQAVGAPEPAESVWALVLEVGARRWAFTVGQLLGEQDLLRRPVDALLAPLGHVAGSATLDDGRLALVASVAGLVYASEAGGVARAPVNPASSPQRPRVLLVDDSLNVRDLIAELLTEGGMDVTQAGDGREALEALNTQVPDLVLTDFEMPNMDGMELLKEIRARWAHLPVVVLTTRGSADDRRRAAMLGANAYLVKTEFEESFLLDSLRRFLGRH
jgi:two-component system chemotaxis sensor kinase CheA/two-component system sensor histidine kinase and response regulator WspE